MNQIIARLRDTGFFHVFGSNVINKVVAFGSGILLVRLLSKNDFGLYSYSYNIITLFLLFNGLGTLTGMLQFGSENRNKDDHLSSAYLKYGFRIGLVFNIILMIAIVVYTIVFKLSLVGANCVLLAMSMIPLVVFISEAQQVYFRTNLMNKEFSYLNTVNTLLITVFSVIGAYLFQIYGVVIFRYFAYLLTIMLGIKLSKDTLNMLKDNNYCLNKKEKSQFLKFSLTATFNNAISHLLYTIDIFLIGIYIGNTDVIASYKTATLIPFALNFIPVSVITYLYPYFCGHNTDKQWIKSNFYRMMIILGLINLIITVILFLFAPLIIKILFGVKYLDSLIPFRILVIGYFFAATFRIPIGNIIVIIKKVQFNLYLSMVTGVLNIILGIIFIRVYGSTGVALATLGVFIFTSVCSTAYLLKWLYTAEV